MKKVLGVLASLVISSLILAGQAVAKEGTVTLSSNDVKCEGISVWQSSNYKVTGRCQGLVYPFATQFEHYGLWARLANGNTVRVDDIDRGYFEGSVGGEITDIFITAESSSSPRRPSDKTIALGSVEAFDFGSKTVGTVATPAPAASTSPKNGGTMTVQNAAEAVTQSGTSVGSVIGQILKALLVIVGVIIVVAVVASLIFRRRGSVST